MSTRAYLSILLFLYSVQYLSAQKIQGAFLGIKGGYSISSLNSSDKSSGNFALKPRKTASIGFVITVPIKRTYSISVEPGYILKGTRISNESLDYKFHYIGGPILFDYYPTERIKVSFGPEVVHLLNAKNHINDSTSVGINNTYNRNWELSATLGLSYTLNFFTDLGIRFNTAFTKATEYDAVLDRRRLYNRYFQVFLMFKIAN